MTGETREAELIDAAGNIIPAKLSMWEEDPDDIDLVRLSLRYAGGEITKSADGWFSAMSDVRRELENNGLLLKLYGASRNVYPSPMSRSMGGGHKAYKLQMGQPAKQSDLVSIFGVGPDIDLASVDEQEQFYRDWLKSLGNL
jgi:hypothetical protein